MFRTISVEPLTPEAYEPFGQVIGSPQEPPTRENEERSYWLMPALDLVDGAFAIVYVEMRAQDYVVRRLHRHTMFEQALIPLGGKAFVHVVAPPGDVPDLSALRAFLVDGSQGVIIGQGTWHRNPAYPLAPKASLVLISRSESIVLEAAERAGEDVRGPTEQIEIDTLTNDEIRLLL
jgi:ureidoglycolate lyase